MVQGELLTPMLRWAFLTLALLQLLAFAPTQWFVLGPLGQLSHQLLGGVCANAPDRSLSLAGVPSAVCARCLGLYLGLGLGVLYNPSWRSESATVAFALGLLFMALDVATEWLGMRAPCSPLRLLTGLCVAVPAAWLVCGNQTGSISRRGLRFARAHLAKRLDTTSKS